MIIYKFLRHGYLNWDILLAMPATRMCGDDAANFINEMFENARKKAIKNDNNDKSEI